MNSVRKKTIRKRINSDKQYKTIIFVLLAVIFVESLIFVCSSKVSAVADPFWIQEAVSEFRHGNYSSFDSGGYMEMYTNQAGLFLISYILSFVYGEFNFLAFQLINCVCLTASYYLMARIMKALGYSNFVSIIIVFIGAMFFPFIMYTTFVYGNIIGLMFSLIGVINAIKYIKLENSKYLLFSTLATAFAICVKQNYLINAIAIVIMIVFSKINLKNKCKYCLALFIFASLMSIIPIKFIRTKTGLPYNQGTPSVAFVAMGLQEGDRAPGWHNGYDIKVYNNNNHQKDLAASESINEIKNRVNFFVEHKGYAVNFFLQKLSSKWSDPSFESLALNQSMIHYTMIKNPNIEILYRNEFYLAVIDYLNIFQFVIYFGTFLFILSLLSNREKDITQIIFLVIFAGGFIFHTFWEAKAQYTITYFILLIPLAIQGYNWLTSLIINKQLPGNKKEIVASFVIALLIFLAFVVMDKKYMLTSITSDAAAYYEYVGNAYQEEYNQNNIYN